MIPWNVDNVFCRSVVDRSKALQQLHRHGQQFHVPFLDRQRVRKVADALLNDEGFGSIVTRFFARLSAVLENPDEGPTFNAAARPGTASNVFSKPMLAYDRLIGCACVS